jgi:hypothetical protein
MGDFTSSLIFLDQQHKPTCLYIMTLVCFFCLFSLLGCDYVVTFPNQGPLILLLVPSKVIHGMVCTIVSFHNFQTNGAKEVIEFLNIFVFEILIINFYMIFSHSNVSLE